jgi:hypothetical protein
VCLLAWGPFAFALELPPSSRQSLEFSPQGGLYAQSDFDRPTWIAVILDPGGASFVAGKGDPLFRGADPLAVGVIQSVTPVSLTLRLSRDGREVRAFPGRPIPGASEFTVKDLLAVTGLEFRSRSVPAGAARLLRGEWYFVGVEAGRAVLQRDIDSSLIIAQAQRQLSAVPVARVDSTTFELSETDAQSAMASGEAIVNNAYRAGQIGLGVVAGPAVEVKTPLVDVQVDRKGFLITNPNMAGRVGLQVGDRILAVNNDPIGGIGDLVVVYKKFKANPSMRTVQVTVERNAQPITLTYRIR